MPSGSKYLAQLADCGRLRVSHVRQQLKLSVHRGFHGKLRRERGKLRLGIQFPTASLGGIHTILMLLTEAPILGPRLHVLDVHSIAA